MTLVEMRLRVVKRGSGEWEIFWGDRMVPGFSSSRRFAFAPPEDDQFHVLRFDLAAAVTDALTDIRLDPGHGAGWEVWIDSVHVATPAVDR